jgi:hypothetical protein
MSSTIFEAVTDYKWDVEDAERDERLGSAIRGVKTRISSAVRSKSAVTSGKSGTTTR